jgi:hypothetical protein
MGWSIGYLPPKEPELLNEFLLLVGKALYLSTVFEAKCKYVLRIMKIATYWEETRSVAATEQLIQTLRDRMLKTTITQLERFSEFNETDIEALLKAKDARNFIAHECANIGELSTASAMIILGQAELLRQHVEFMAAGDNLVSRWVYEIEEKEPAPTRIQREYQAVWRDWLFARIDKLNGA